MSGVENSTYVGGLNQLNPEAQDFISQGDDHLKLIKKCLLNTFPGFSRPIDGALFPWSQTPGAITVYAKFLEQTGRIGALEYFTSPSHPDGAILRANNNLSDIADPAQARVNLGIPALVDVLLKSQNLADVPSVVDARNNLGVPAATDVLYANSNLSDLQDVAIARQNLDVHDKASTLEKSQNLADVPNANTARANLGAAAQTDVLLKAQNLADVPDKAAARVNLDVPSNADLVSAISAALIGLSAVTSVNGQLGDVVLGAADVGADPAGTAASLVTAHEIAGDPHPQYTTVAEAAAAAPVQSVNGMTGAVTLEEEVLQYANLAAFPVSGAAGTLYIAADTGLVYRWDGSAYAPTGLQPIANNTVLGNVSGAAATPTALNKAQVQGLLLPFVAPPSLSYSQLAHTLTSALYSQVLGGSQNTINNANYSVIAGAASALIGTPTSYNCFIGGGYSGQVYGQSAALLGGYDCAATGDYAALAGGNACIAYGKCFVGGGDSNWARGSNNFIGSGFGHDTQGSYNAIPGGYDNEIANTTYAFIGSGRGNRISASGSYAFVGAGKDNQANAVNATVLNGFTAIVNGNYSSVLNGLRITVNADYATIVNGHAITAEPSAKYATILGANFYDSGQYRRSVRNPGTLAHLSCPSSLSDEVYPQHEALPLQAKTTNATPTDMACGAESLGSPSVLPALGSQLGQGKLYALCELDVVGSDGTDVYMSTVKFCVVKTAAGVNPAIAGTPTVVHSYTTAGAATWGVTIATNPSTADDLVYLNINCTGEAAKTVQWNGYLRFTRQSRA